MPPPVIDMHVHVGLNGDEWQDMGGFSDHYRNSIVFKIFRAYTRLSEHEVKDSIMLEKTVETISQSKVDKIVCLALDPIYDSSGTRKTELSNMWVDNRYIVEKLRPRVPEKILFGCSVHPYDPKFEERVRECVANGAVLIKWLPSAQEFTTADARVREAMKFLATAKNGKPLPLLLHCGGEYAIPPYDRKTLSYDFLSWTFWDNLWNSLRFKKAWYKPDIRNVHANLKAALDAGAIIIFAHCGAPYFSGSIFGGALEHSDFKTVCSYLDKTKRGDFAGACYADVSCFVIPTRVPFHDKVKKMPPELVLMGSDFPVPIMELSAGPEEWWDDFKAIVTEGKLERLIIPEDNLLDVNNHELHEIFGDHPMFSNFERLM
jgi:hypothetical protein